jgi:outer membrane protein
MLKPIFSLILSVSITTLIAQETWTLEKCINHAVQNSRFVKQSQIAVKNADLGNKQAKLDRYPSVSASTNYGLNFGRSVNPSTYTFENQTTSFNSLGLNSNVTLYNGGRINNTIKQSEADKEAAKADLEQSSQSIALQVASAYLQILLFDEQLENAKKRLNTTQSQLDRTLKQIKAGQLSPAAQYDIQAQAARDEQQIVTAQNNIEIAYLNLKNLLELSPDFNIKIERPSVVIPKEANPDGYMFKAVYTQALTNQAVIRADEARIKSAELGVKVAKSALFPVIGLNYGINTNYSSTITKDREFITTDISQQVRINNVPATITYPNQSVPVSSEGKKPYFSQVGDNFGQGLGVNVQIPIFDGLSRQINVQRQVLNVENQKLLLERDRQQLKADVQNAIANAKAAKKQYEAAQKSYDAFKIAYENTDKRFQVGAANGFEFTQAKNNMDTAERDVIVAKYDYLFKLKIVEFYEGKKLSLK